jgi:hypothetical protein
MTRLARKVSRDSTTGTVAADAAAAFFIDATFVVDATVGAAGSSIATQP